MLALRREEVDRLEEGCSGVGEGIQLKSSRGVRTMF